LYRGNSGKDLMSGELFFVAGRTDQRLLPNLIGPAILAIEKILDGYTDKDLLKLL
jgi:hypothetical protein